jgi:hypothetical protein
VHPTVRCRSISVSGPVARELYSLHRPRLESTAHLKTGCFLRAIRSFPIRRRQGQTKSVGSADSHQSSVIHPSTYKGGFLIRVPCVFLIAVILISCTVENFRYNIKYHNGSLYLHQTLGRLPDRELRMKSYIYCHK